jgi:membrane fusion protein, multidrug efflux system
MVTSPLRFWVAFLCSLLIAPTGCREDGAAAPRPTKDLRVPVEVAVLTTKDFEDALDISAVVRPHQKVVISAETSGSIVSAPIEEGERVSRGALLAKVDKDVNQARIARLQSQLKSVEREKERTARLSREGLATPQQLDQAESAVRAASLGLEEAQVGLGKSTVRSPIDGHVSRTYVEVGSFVAPGSPLAEIIVYDRVIVEAGVPESAVRYIRKGSQVKVWVPALEKHVDGTVKRRAIVATPKTRTFEVDITVDNESLELLPGMRAKVIVEKKVHRDALVVPRDAILQGVRGQEAMVLPGNGAEGEAVVRRVTLGPAKGNEVVVTEGLKAGERLIVKGHRSLADGSAVRVVGP